MKTKKSFKKLLSENKNMIIAFAVIAVVVGASLLANTSGEQLQGYLKPSLTRTIKLGLPVTSEVAAVTHEAAPTNQISRGELATLMVTKKGINVSSYKNCLPGIVGKKYETSLCYLFANNLAAASTPIEMQAGFWDAGLNKAEASKWMVNVFYTSSQIYSGNAVFYTDVKTSDWYYPYIMTLASKGVYGSFPNGTTPFVPGDMLTKVQAKAWLGYIR
jgi:hypothetical protein